MKVPEEVLKRVAEFIYTCSLRDCGKVGGALLLKPLNGFYKVLSLGFKCPYGELVVCFTAF
jgi:hypothetical protein